MDAANRGMGMSYTKPYAISHASMRSFLQNSFVVFRISRKLRINIILFLENKALGGKMNKIATLGPAGTFSELATKKYIEKINKNMEIAFYPTITKVFKAIGEECELGIIPIENTLDGYVQLVLDLLAQTDLQIIYELVIPIEFSFVGNALDIVDIKSIYAQFKTQGQCYNFLEQFNNINLNYSQLFTQSSLNGDN